MYVQYVLSSCYLHTKKNLYQPVRVPKNTQRWLSLLRNNKQIRTDGHLQNIKNEPTELHPTILHFVKARTGEAQQV